MTLVTEEDSRTWLRAMPQWTSVAESRLCILIDLLREENQHQNLVAAASLDSVWVRHIADSAQLLSRVPRETGGSWVDLGTGAGFPGLVIAALEPERQVHLIESRRRRIEWLERAAAAMDLNNVVVHGSRIEQVKTFAARFISARAFAPLDRLLELSVRFSTAETLWLLPKGRSAQHELAQLRGWNQMFHVEQSITDPEAGVLVGQVLGRVAATRKESRP